jgi:hypothetical protein
VGKLYNKVVSGFDYLILVEVMDYANYNQMKESFGFYLDIVIFNIHFDIGYFNIYFDNLVFYNYILVFILIF